MSNTAPLKSPYYTAAEVAQYLRLSLRQVRRLIADGHIQVTRFGRSIRIHERELESFLKRPNKLY